MKNTIAVAALTALSMLTAVSCRDGHDHGPRRVVLPAGTVHDGWYFAAGDQVVIDGTVNGDVYAAGGIIEINGTVNGDLLAAGGQVHVGGRISDDVRTAGGNLAFSGTVGKNVTAAGGTVTVEHDASIAGSLLAAAGSVHIAGAVEHDAMVAGGEMSQTGNVGGDLTFRGGSLAILSGGKVGGNLEATVRSVDKVDTAGAIITGSTTITLEQRPAAHHIAGIPVWWFVFRVLFIASLLVTGLAFILFRPALFLGIGNTMLHQPLKSLLWGVIALVVTPFAAIILMVTIVGIPLGLILSGVYLVALYLSQLTLGILVAVRIISGDTATGWSAFWPFAVGLIVVQLVSFIPVAGFIVCLAGLLFGLGAMVITCTTKQVRA
jgi:hypothetical protein